MNEPNLPENVKTAIELLKKEGIDFHLMVYEGPKKVWATGRSDGQSQGWMFDSMLRFIYQNVLPGKEALCREAMIALIRDIFRDPEEQEEA